MSRWFVYPILLIWSGLAFVFGWLAHVPEPVPDAEAQYRAERVALFRAVKAKARILIAGDSITSDIEWNEFLNETSVINRSARGETTDGLLRRLDTLVSVQPEKTFLLVGINDLTRGDDPGEIAARYARIVNALPGKVYALAIFPCVVEGPRCEQLNPRIDELNRRVRSLPGIHFVRPVPDFLPRYSYDGIHLTAEGALELVKSVDIIANAALD